MNIQELIYGGKMICMDGEEWQNITERQSMVTDHIYWVRVMDVDEETVIYESPTHDLVGVFVTGYLYGYGSTDSAMLLPNNQVYLATHHLRPGLYARIKDTDIDYEDIY